MSGTLRIAALAAAVMFGMTGALSAANPGTDPAAAAPAPEAKKGPPPLPVHTIEGAGGGAVTQIAYPVNAGAKDELFGLPAVSYTYLDLNDKGTHTAAITETLFGKLELGYAYTYMNLGTLDERLGIDDDEVAMHTFTARYQVVEEGQFGEWTPSVMVGLGLKYNDGINDFNRKLGGALDTIDYEKDWGVDFTVHATKMFANVFGRPLILTAGLRVTEGAWAGLAGFGDEYKFAPEANFVYLITDWLFIAYEYRFMPDVLGTLGSLVQDEQDWHIVDVGVILGENLTLVGLWGNTGNILNSDVHNAWAVQVKWEF